MNFERLFNSDRFLVGDALTNGDIEVHYVQLPGSHLPSFAIMRGERYEWVTWNDLGAARREIVTWVNRHNLNKAPWQRLPSGSDADIWDNEDGLKYIALHTRYGWLFSSSPYTGQPVQVIITPQSHNHTTAYFYKSNKVRRVLYTQYDGKEKPLHWVGAIVGVRKSSRDSDIGYARINSIAEIRIADVSDESIAASGVASQRQFVALWKHDHVRYTPTHMAYRYDLSAISSVRPDLDIKAIVQGSYKHLGSISYQLTLPLKDAAVYTKVK